MKNLRTLEVLVKLLDSQFGIGRFKFGLDPLLGLVPGLGDIISFLLAIYIVSLGAKLNLPADKISVMVGNVVVDLILGLIPVVGDVGDFVFKANSRNLEIIKKHVNSNIIEGGYTTAPRSNMKVR